MKDKKFKHTIGRRRTQELLSKVARAYNKLSDRDYEFWRMYVRDYDLKSLKTGKKITTGRAFFIYVNTSLLEVGEEIKMKAPKFKRAQYIEKIGAVLSQTYRRRDIKLLLSEPIKEDTKILLSATRPLKRGRRYIDKSWFKEIGFIDSSFESGDSITEMYKKIYKSLGRETYKICFKYREVDTGSGFSNITRDFTLYFDEKE